MNTHTYSLYFFGTHTFAATILESCIRSDLYTVLGVITKPDEPQGRKKVLTPTPVKTMALKHNISVFEPETLKNFTFPHKSDFCLVAQYGKIIPEHILSFPRKGCVNIHTSLLPAYRGASPIQTAIKNGETETGITFILMDQGLDTGPIILQKKYNVDPNHTYKKIDADLADMASQLLPELVHFLSGEIVPTPQNDSCATYTKKLEKQDGVINWDNDAVTIYNQYRAFTPWPGTTTIWNKTPIKIIDCRPSKKTIPIKKMEILKNTLHIGCKNGSLIVNTLQPAGKKEMSISAFLNGYAKKLEQNPYVE